jgi:hypothetical protein
MTTPSRAQSKTNPPHIVSKLKKEIHECGVKLGHPLLPGQNDDYRPAISEINKLQQTLNKTRGKINQVLGKQERNRWTGISTPFSLSTFCYGIITGVGGILLYEHYALISALLHLKP